MQLSNRKNVKYNFHIENFAWKNFTQTDTLLKTKDKRLKEKHP